MFAVNTIRLEPHYRRSAFDAGLRRLGYNLVAAAIPRSPQDLLVLWNRQGGHEAMARDWETNGGTVIVAENAYLEPAKNSMYAISAHGHNGSGWFPMGTEDRFSALGVELQPWRTGEQILVCGQRGIGSTTMASPQQWELRTARHLKAAGHANVRIRQHPGRSTPETTLEQDLTGAALCMVWSSASGVKALTMGVPVNYCAPHWICEWAAMRGADDLAAPMRDDTLRQVAMQRMAHGQWTVAEIEAGEPFARIMANIGQAKW